MKKLIFIVPVLFLISCEDPEYGIKNSEPIFGEENIDKLSSSKVEVTSLETVTFSYNVKTDGLPKRDLYDSITFSVSGIEEELRVFTIGYEDPNSPIGNPAEYEITIWHHTFMSIGSYETKLIGYKNGNKKTLDALTINVTNPYNFFNINWSDSTTKTNSYINTINNFVLTVNSKKVGGAINNKMTANAAFSWKYKQWPFTQNEYEKGRAVLYNAMIKEYGKPTYTSEDDLVNIFNDLFIEKIDEMDDIECIWITEKSKIALLSSQRFSDTQKEYYLHAQEKN